MTKMIVSMDKQYETNCGRPVKIFEIMNEKEASGDMAVFGAFLGGDGRWNTCTWYLDGKWAPEITGLALREVKPKHTIKGWFNVYPHCHATVCVYGTKLDADKAACRNRIACKYIEFEVEEGEGLQLEGNDCEEREETE